MKKIEMDVTTAIDRAIFGKDFVNTTKHPIRFQSSENAQVTYEVPPSGVVINAEFREESAGTHPSGAAFVRARILPDPVSEKALVELEREHPGKIILGSLVAAQAFPGRVVALCSVPGFERVPANEKRMRDDKFTVF